MALVHSQARPENSAWDEGPHTGPIARTAARRRDDIGVSFEFFPPKTAAMEQALWSCVQKLEGLQPDFVSVTYGAGGSTQEYTLKTVARMAS